MIVRRVLQFTALQLAWSARMLSSSCTVFLQDGLWLILKQTVGSMKKNVSLGTFIDHSSHIVKQDMKLILQEKKSVLLHVLNANFLWEIVKFLASFWFPPYSLNLKNAFRWICRKLMSFSWFADTSFFNLNLQFWYWMIHA